MEETEGRIYHKIEPNRKVRVFSSNYQGRDYYKIQLTQKNYDGSEFKFYINVQFKKGVTLPNVDGKGTDIIIKKAYENFRPNPKDEYNPIMYLLIVDFEIKETQEQIEKEAYSKYQQNLYENENEGEVIIDDNFLD